MASSIAPDSTDDADRQDPEHPDRLPPADGPKPRRLGRAMPSPDPNTNLMIADIVLRGASVLLRRKLRDRMLLEEYDPDQATKFKDGKGLIRTVGLFGASRLAAGSLPGLAAVAGGLFAKTLYDRGKARELRRRRTREAARSRSS
ncbi:hypothetical protein [Erythrobacter sp. HL-111]|uniref:hypothetical protein n=1 Tax=Erythrobacter sp. HL-111 TaxID=1798193 RepID=UPI0006DBABF6|nr:hypothetical protein [Erythrobacter sp. HL-111]KPP84858.1 MAG: hypothetical protein HLUCCO15_13780 [Erythrobacteraceae bacterium HL-111]SDS41417.1 hypothetical protein SAMN04515621_1522 [Erythrobacter sp. HL-111]